MKKKTQTDLVLEYIMRYGSITQADAFSFIGCTRLAARINDLRRAGLGIHTELQEGVNRWGQRTRYAIYRLTSVAR